MTANADTTATIRLEGHGDDQSIRDSELFSARRSLALLKRKLGHERIVELLGPDIAESSAWLRDAVARSGEEQLAGSTTLVAEGISAAQFGAWLGSSFDREDVMLAAHPEHYVIRNEELPHIVETLGDRVCSFFMDGWDAAEEVEPGSHRSRLLLADGTVFGWVSTRFQEAESGFTAKLSVGVPTACGQAVVDQHLQHFSVEFRNWILTAAEEGARA